MSVLHIYFKGTCHRAYPEDIPYRRVADNLQDGNHHIQERQVTYNIMSEIKVNLSLTLQGGVLLSEQECSKNPKKNYDSFDITVTDENRKRSTLHVSVRKCQEVRQNIRLSREAYDYMTEDFPPEPRMKKQWKSMSSYMRVQWHCRNIAESMGATGFTFEILDD